MIATAGQFCKVASARFAIGVYNINYAERTERGGNAGRHCQFESRMGRRFFKTMFR
jgi:hypothetical protein